MTFLSDLLETRHYLPILALRPAEMTALEELPEADKNLLLPIVLLKRWLTAEDFGKSIDRVLTAYGERRWIADLDPIVFSEHAGQTNDAELRLAGLSSAVDGYRNWCEFIAEHAYLIPCLQIRIAQEVELEIQRLVALGRGLVVKVPRLYFGQLSALLVLLNRQNADDVLFVLDFGQSTDSDLVSIGDCTSFVDLITSQMPAARIAVSATSFPDSFVGRSSKEILERSFFNAVCEQRPNARLMFSDRGSAREKPVSGGGGKPTARIDYPTFDRWYFFREEADDGYVLAAQELKSTTEIWNPLLRIWGTQMIDRTALGDPYGINSALKATAVRLNIHMHKQVYYSSREAAFVVDEEDWVD